MRALKTAALTTGALAGALLTAVVMVAGCGSSGPSGLDASVKATVPAHVTWKSSAKFGRWTDGRYFVLNNEWNTSQAGPQTIWADSYHQWGVV
jgi:hypothetical protein